MKMKLEIEIYIGGDENGGSEDKDEGSHCPPVLCPSGECEPPRDYP